MQKIKIGYLIFMVYKNLTMYLMILYLIKLILLLIKHFFQNFLKFMKVKFLLMIIKVSNS